MAEQEKDYEVWESAVALSLLLSIVSALAVVSFVLSYASSPIWLVVLTILFSAIHVLGAFLFSIEIFSWKDSLLKNVWDMFLWEKAFLSLIWRR